MNKYSVSLIRPLTMTMEVEATCEAEAMTKALKNVVGSEDILCWNTQTAQVTGAQLIAYADLDAEKLEAMLNVLRNNGFEVIIAILKNLLDITLLVRHRRQK